MKTEKEQLLSELESLKKRIESFDKPKFEVGKWYYIKHKKPSFDFVISGALICYQGNNLNQRHYGFNYIGEWSSDFGNSWQEDIDGAIESPATPQEVEAALIKEAEKRYKKGQVVMCAMDNTTWTIDAKFNGSGFINNTGTTSLTDGSGAYQFYNGKWATIIKDETIKIGSYEVKIYKGDGISNGYTLIDGNKFTGDFWMAAKEISEHSRAAIVVGCDSKKPFETDSFACHQWKVPLETINAILNKL